MGDICRSEAEVLHTAKQLAADLQVRFADPCPLNLLSLQAISWLIPNLWSWNLLLLLHSSEDFPWLKRNNIGPDRWRNLFENSCPAVSNPWLIFWAYHQISRWFRLYRHYTRSTAHCILVRIIAYIIHNAVLHKLLLMNAALRLDIWRRESREHIPPVRLYSHQARSGCIGSCCENAHRLWGQRQCTVHATCVAFIRRLREAPPVRDSCPENLIHQHLIDYYLNIQNTPVLDPAGRTFLAKITAIRCEIYL